MSARPFFDTGILIYSVIDHPRRSTAAQELLSCGGMLSVQVLNEFVAIAHRKLKMPWENIQTALASFETLCGPTLPLTMDTHKKAVALAARYGYAIYDALILASALEHGCDTLYSEDMQHRQKIGGLTISNPFRAKP